MLLHKLFQYELNIESADFLSALIGLLENYAYELEEDEEAGEGGLTLSAKARLILNRLIQTGWIDREYMDGSFTEIITPRDYAITVIKLLHDLSETRTQEYNSLVFSTYSALNQAKENHPAQMYEAVVTARSNTEHLFYELKTLYHGIRGYLKKIYGQHNVNALLRDHFDDYKELADRVYHPIKTMDSVPRYKDPIRAILLDTLRDPVMLDNMCKRAIAVRGFRNEEEARAEILSAIHYVLDAYQSIDDVIREIDRKHRTYTNLSVNTIRYHMTADHTIAGKLAVLLRTYGEAEEAKKTEILSLMEQGVCVNQQEFIDGQSLWHKNAKNRRIQTEPLAIQRDNRPSEEEALRMMASLEGRYSTQQIVAYMKRLLGEKQAVTTAEIGIGDDADFIFLLLATIRAGERRIGFAAEVGQALCEINGYRVPELTFVKKNGGKNVE